MNDGNLMLLLQLVNGIEENFSLFEKAYNDSDKQGFDDSKTALLNIQSKIDYMLKNVS